jgi:hypothetical protein
MSSTQKLQQYNFVLVTHCDIVINYARNLKTIISNSIAPLKVITDKLTRTKISQDTISEENIWNFFSY